MVAAAAGNRSQSIWRRLEELQVNILVRTNMLLVSCVSNLITSWHSLLKSVFNTWVLAKHVQQGSLSYEVWSQGGADYIICQPFSRAQLLELWHGVLRALL